MNTFFNVLFYFLLGLYTFTFFIVLLLEDKNKLKTFNTVAICTFLVYAVVRLVFIPAKLKGYEVLSNFGLYFSSGILIAVIVLLTFLFDKNKDYAHSKSISFAGVCIALAFALSFIKIEFLGGSVTLASALPLIIYSYLFGAKRGVLCGIIFGILQFIQKPTIYQPMQTVLDYPVAFGAIGVSGIVKDFKLKPIIKFIIGACLGLSLRYVTHVISGYFVFYIFALEGWNPFWYSVVFNMNVLIDLVIVLLIGSCLFLNKSFNLSVERFKNK